MAEIADRFRDVAGTFTETAQRVPDDAWDNPAPCEGWVARDVVGHMIATERKTSGRISALQDATGAPASWPTTAAIELWPSA